MKIPGWGGTDTVENGMSKGYDAVIIGAGIIGAAIGYELSKRGRRTLNVDMLAGRGLRIDLQLLRHHPRLLLDARRLRDGL